LPYFGKFQITPALPPPSNNVGDEDSTEVFAEEKEMETMRRACDNEYASGEVERHVGMDIII